MSDRWGVWDTVDHLWMGGDQGPIVLESRELARVAAQVVEFQVLGTDLGGRFVARELPEGTFRLRDKVKTKRGTLEALLLIEGVDDGS
jgi:hypothetical protein